MYSYNKNTIITFLTLLAIFVLTACEPDVPKDRYSLQECKSELLDAKDYEHDGGIDHILVIKKDRKMYLYKNGKVQQVIPVSLGKNPVGQKQQKGDNRTPEGEFFIDRKLCSPKYYRSLCISYPRPEDIERAAQNGVNPGGDITIHAQPKWNEDGHGDSYTLSRNWTEGCVSVTNSVMKELWYAVREGVPVTIK